MHRSNQSSPNYLLRSPHAHSRAMTVDRFVRSLLIQTDIFVSAQRAEHAKIGLLCDNMKADPTGLCVICDLRAEHGALDPCPCAAMAHIAHIWRCLASKWRVRKTSSLVIVLAVIIPSIVVNFLLSSACRHRHRSALAVYKYKEMSSRAGAEAEAEGGSGQWSIVMSAPQTAN